MRDRAEKKRMEKPGEWRRWGSYLSLRQWGTVREDYSGDGSAWEYLDHDTSRSRAYRWGEDGLLGISDDRQYLCFSCAYWNRSDPILKERFFGLSGNEGNHGEDVKELYHFLDATPSHSYMKARYLYPQAEFPYRQLVEENRNRGRDAGEFEITDTVAFADNRFFEIIIEYAKATPEDILIRITTTNRGGAASFLDVIPQLWFRNTWSWNSEPGNPNFLPPDRPRIHQQRGKNVIEAKHKILGTRRLYFEGSPEVLFCENETNRNVLGGAVRDGNLYKDGLHRTIIHGDEAATSSKGPTTKTGLWYRESIGPGETVTTRLRLTPKSTKDPFGDFDSLFSTRIAEADDFYLDHQSGIDEEERRVQRQAFAGLIWSKQFYYLDIPEWLSGDPLQPAPPDQRKRGRNFDWPHLNNADIISMPDTWEYPWYAAWDLAFHCIPFGRIDPDFAKSQLLMLTKEWYMHPNGQLPAYEWAFGDVNPPVHAWAAWRVFQMDRNQRGDAGDLRFLEQIFHKLLINFTWWVNRKDAEGLNIFQGGFLGLDNIGVFDRSAPLPGNARIDQSDGTSWMAMYSLNLMRIALELSRHNHVYEDLATKFFEHFLYIAEAMYNMGDQGVGLWDSEDEFYYDVLKSGDGVHPIKIRSIVGLIPLFAVEILEPELLAEVPEFTRRLEWFLEYRPDLAKLVSRWNEPGIGDRHLLSLLRGHRMKRLLMRLLDEDEFLSDFGVRGLSKYHRDHPYEMYLGGERYAVSYEPGVSKTSMFGGNSNWRGPIWFPINYLIVESLQRFHHYYGDDFLIECPTGSGRMATILDASEEISKRLISLFLSDKNGARPANGEISLYQEDPMFYEYFHGDTGQGLGASHQTGWTALVAKLIYSRGIRFDG